MRTMGEANSETVCFSLRVRRFASFGSVYVFAIPRGVATPVTRAPFGAHADRIADDPSPAHGSSEILMEHHRWDRSRRAAGCPPSEGGTVTLLADPTHLDIPPRTAVQPVAPLDARSNGAGLPAPRRSFDLRSRGGYQRTVVGTIVYFDDEARTYMVRTDDGSLVRVPLREIQDQEPPRGSFPDPRRGREAGRTAIRSSPTGYAISLLRPRSPLPRNTSPRPRRSDTFRSSCLISRPPLPGRRSTRQDAPSCSARPLLRGTEPLRPPDRGTFFGCHDTSAPRDERGIRTPSSRVSSSVFRPARRESADVPSRSCWWGSADAGVDRR